MLSFYLLDDAATLPSPARLAELPKAGEMPSEDFAHLQAQRVVEARLNPAVGFRWTSRVVPMKLQLLLHRYPTLSPSATDQVEAAQRLYLILLNASAAGMGLVASAT